jgi:hypothetical protein
MYSIVCFRVPILCVLCGWGRSIFALNSPVVQYHCLARLFEPTAAAGCVHHIRAVSCYHISVALHLIFEAYIYHMKWLGQPTHHLRFREKIEGNLFWILNRICCCGFVRFENLSSTGKISIWYPIIFRQTEIGTSLTNSIEKSPPSEANFPSFSQEISNIPRLWNPMVHYRVHKSSSVIPILSQMNPVHMLTPQFVKINFDIIQPSVLWSSK